MALEECLLPKSFPGHMIVCYFVLFFVCLAVFGDSLVACEPASASTSSPYLSRPGLHGLDWIGIGGQELAVGKA